MAKKFFYNRVYNTRRNIINIIIIGICLVGIVACFIVVSNFQGRDNTTPEKLLNIKEEVIIEVNQDVTKDMFFTVIENVNLDEIDVSYDKNYDNSKPGKYKVTLLISGKKYNSTLNVVDTTRPVLVTQDVTITEGDNYTARDFVSNCTDNSNENCYITFYAEGLDEDGLAIDYSKYTNAGIYSVKISAKDSSGNSSIDEAKLTIKTKAGEKPEVQQTECKYGNDTYDTNEYLATVIVATNHCAVNLNLYKDPITTADINKIMENETLKIQKDIGSLNIYLKGDISLNRHIRTIVNKSGSGIVGYELTMTVILNNKEETDVIEEYKLDNKGNRVFSINKYNLK